MSAPYMQSIFLILQSNQDLSARLNIIILDDVCTIYAEYILVSAE